MIPVKFVLCAPLSAPKRILYILYDPWFQRQQELLLSLSFHLPLLRSRFLSPRHWNEILSAWRAGNVPLVTFLRFHFAPTKHPMFSCVTATTKYSSLVYIHIANGRDLSPTSTTHSAREFNFLVYGVPIPLFLWYSTLPREAERPFRIGITMTTLIDHWLEYRQSSTQ